MIDIFDVIDNIHLQILDSHLNVFKAAFCDKLQVLIVVCLMSTVITTLPYLIILTNTNVTLAFDIIIIQ